MTYDDPLPLYRARVRALGETPARPPLKQDVREILRALSRAGCIALLGAGLLACTTIRTTDPARTATEQLLVSTAADRAAEKLTLAPLKAAGKVYVDASQFDGVDSKYAIAAIREHFLRQGLALTDDVKAADAVVQIRAGALSIDRDSLLIGVPKLALPLPLTGTVATPEIAFFCRERQTGIAKFAATGYNVASGTLLAATGPQVETSHKTHLTLLLFLSWWDDDLHGPRR